MWVARGAPRPPALAATRRREPAASLSSPFPPLCTRSDLGRRAAGLLGGMERQLAAQRYALQVDPGRDVVWPLQAPSLRAAHKLADSKGSAVLARTLCPTWGSKASGPAPALAPTASTSDCENAAPGSAPGSALCAAAPSLASSLRRRRTSTAADADIRAMEEGGASPARALTYGGPAQPSPRSSPLRRMR